MGAWLLTRRLFLRAAALLGMAHTVGCETLQIPGITTRGVTAFRRTGRGRHISNAAKRHNANHVYATRAAALADLAHPGDKSGVVAITLPAVQFFRLFGSGRQAVDLRQAR